MGRARELLHGHVVDANDGIIATAGVLEGFAGAGASESTLFVASIAAMVAGALALAGTKYVEQASERERQLALIAEERAELAARPDDEVAELAAHYERKGLEPDLARRVAEQLSAADPLGAQLETEHGIQEPMRRSAPLVEALAGAVAFTLGAAVPFVMVSVFPAALEAWAVAVAAALSLVVTAIVGARSGGTSIVRGVLRTLSIGVGTMAVSYVSGLLLF
ncbi:VIT1/CCC1 transporter family protein [Agromyces larvae]|uniref:VIT1/CCC1 transporter family protein n=1 Tax=Agromyces larvae TaxID=2929802 RepID=A0ABY4BV27_9MICO|nr:VIT1/CCC1 transporter family protein [Agromyces larvae]UOE43038.1 VIT1/CCC1 transporter family protein [Agromyces larvae]